ncbi:MAG: DUF3105 domain-containing protein [SAR202 cluster bacterium]|nr:DUF3105 domain-containing protein [SAR202 cluster bacterium]
MTTKKTSTPTPAQKRQRLTPTQARAARRERQDKKKKLQRGLWAGLVGLISILFLVSLFAGSLPFSNNNPSGPSGPGTRYESQGGTHIAVGDSHAAYSTKPATSGWHYDTTAPWGVYTEPVTEERVVHNLEHGGVIIYYNCPDNSCADDVAKLTSFVRSTDETILAPYPDMDAKFALVAWTFMQKLDAYDEEAVRAFVNAHLNSPNSPEPFAR